MLSFEWNALRAGDEVLVHDPRDSDRLVPGVVALVEARQRAHAVGVTVGDGAAAGQTAAVLWPARLAVHTTANDASGPCWRCDASSAI